MGRCLIQFCAECEISRLYLLLAALLLGAALGASGADDPNDQLSEGVALGPVNKTLVARGTISAGTNVDLFAFTVTSGQRISFDIDQTSGLDSYIRLFNTNGAELAANDD